MTTQWLLEEVGTVTEKNIDVIKRRVSSLSDQQLNWRSTAQAWSINEVLAHLNSYALFYHEAFQTKIANTRFRLPKETFTSSPLGRSAWISMKLGKQNNVKRKFNAPKNYDPRLKPELVTTTLVNDFLATQQELLSIIESSVAVSLRKVKVPISISKLVRLRLGDALLFVAYHNERHVQQIQNILKDPKFPKK